MSKLKTVNQICSPEKLVLKTVCRMTHTRSIGFETLAAASVDSDEDMLISKQLPETKCFLIIKLVG